MFFFLFGSVTLGFFSGILRGFIMIMIFYLSMILASLYFTALGNAVEARYPAMMPEIASLISFLWLLAVSFVLLSLAGMLIFRCLYIPKRFQHIDRLGGMVLGFLLALFVMVTLSFLLWNITIFQKTADLPLLQWISKSTQHSFLVTYIVRSLPFNMAQTLAPILPGGAEMLFITTP
jgi:membrane protein required for colicin V production